MRIENATQRRAVRLPPEGRLLDLVISLARTMSGYLTVLCVLGVVVGTGPTQRGRGFGAFMGTRTVQDRHMEE